MADPRREDHEPPSDAIVDALERGGRIGRFRWRPEAGGVWWSDELYRIYGLPTDTELTFDAVLSLIPDTDVDWVRSQARGTGTMSSPLVFWQHVRRPDGEDRTVEVRAWPEARRSSSARRRTSPRACGRATSATASTASASSSSTRPPRASAGWTARAGSRS